MTAETGDAGRTENAMSGGRVRGSVIQARNIGRISFAGQPKDDSRERLEAAKARLAEEVRRQWEGEVAAQGLRRPEPIRLQWANTRRAVAVRTAVAPPTPAGQAGPTRATTSSVPSDALGRCGDLDGLVQAFRTLPQGHLVMLGERGSGKTVWVMLLTLGLLGSYEPGDPVPVLLTASSWESGNTWVPGVEHLRTWLARRLVEEYPFLADKEAYGAGVAQRLVTGGHVFLLLDGLDEMSEALHAPALGELDDSGQELLVVTCRVAEYERAVERSGRVLSRAVVKEMLPIGVRQAEGFLIADRPWEDTRWQSLLAELRDRPDFPDLPLSRALTSPLMVALARVIYAPPAKDPRELLSLPDLASVERHLLTAFLPAVYRPRPAPPGGSGRVPASYGLPEARGWLGFIARHMARNGTHDLEWWQVAGAVPGWVAGLVFGVVSGLMFGFIGAAAGGPVIGLVFGVSFGSAGFVVQAVPSRRPAPARVEIRLRGTVRVFALRFTFGCVTGMALGFGFELPSWAQLVLGAPFGLAVALHAWLRAPSDATKVASPGLALEQDRVSTLVLGVSFALPFGLTFGTVFAFTDPRVSAWPTLGPVGELTFNTVFGLAGALAGWTVGHLSYGRVGRFAYSAVGAVVSGVVFPPADDPGFAFGTGIAFGVACGLVVMLGRPWGAFVFAHALLALTGRLPWRLMRFLQDAHRRGVLRQAGAVFQFRHARVRDRLTSHRDDDL
ncbi:MULTISPECIES: NACHT domain-containing protein [Streptomyces]|uniref:NACHT domain-containing protein n=1 Tax=Streptomyces abikoensis TaxID=97398 RepID=A0ABW7TG93_9ACTN